MTKLPCDPTQRYVFRRVDPPCAPLFHVPAPGTWYQFVGEHAYIVCPECGHAGRLGHHGVDAHGMINPSIVCPMASCGDGVARCSAHYYGRLEGWAA